MKLAGIILAGGASRRMGSPKALLDYQGETFLDRLIRLFGSTCDSVTVVLGHEPEIIRSGIKRGGEAQFVINAQHQLGQLTSLQCALRGGLDAADLFVYTPVDYPAIELATIQKLRDAVTDDDLFVIPRYMGQRGHPVMFRREVRTEFLALPANAQARDVVHRYVSRTRYIDVEDPGIMRDVDDRLAYHELLKTVQVR